MGCWEEHHALTHCLFILYKISAEGKTLLLTSYCDLFQSSYETCIAECKDNVTNILSFVGSNFIMEEMTASLTVLIQVVCEYNAHWHCNTHSLLKMRWMQQYCLQRYIHPLAVGTPWGMGLYMWSGLTYFLLIIGQCLWETKWGITHKLIILW